MRTASVLLSVALALVVMGASQSPVTKSFDASSANDMVQFGNVAATDTTSLSYELLKAGNSAVKPPVVYVYAVTDATFTARAISVSGVDTTWPACIQSADSVTTVYAGTSIKFSFSDCYALEFKSGTGTVVVP